jgi:hypothetical protein
MLTIKILSKKRLRKLALHVFFLLRFPSLDLGIVLGIKPAAKYFSIIRSS